MGKNQRAKKKLRTEKAKTHIKTTTKFLPKGQNVTNTSFKIKPIVVPRQLEEKNLYESTVTSKRKFTIPELISKLKHYNDNIKVDSCTQLEEIIKNRNHQEYQTYLSQILINTSFLMQDKDKKVRKACIKLLEAIIKSVPISTLNPFISYIVAYLRCAMTNVDRNIQEDSLLVLDTMLIGDKMIIFNHFEKIFPEFLSLISRLRNESSNERTLTLNLGSKLTNVKWRIKVLSRLELMLKMLLDASKCPENNNSKQSDASLYNQPVYKQYKDVNMATVDSNVRGMTQIMTLIPLLYESWLEVMPERQNIRNTDQMTILTVDSAAILNCVVRIVYLLHKYTQKAEDMAPAFDSENSNKFLQSLLDSFPYAKKTGGGSQLSKELSKVLTSSDDPKCVQENLFICYYAYVIKPKQMKGKTDAALSFVKRCLLQSSDYLTESNCEIFIEILVQILKTPAGKQLYEMLIDTYSSANIPRQLRKSLMNILTGSDFRSEKYDNWLRTLTNTLHVKQQQITPDIVAVILKLTREGNQLIRQEISDNFHLILEKLSKYQLPNDLVASQLCWTFYYADCFQQYRREIENFDGNSKLGNCFGNVCNSMEIIKM